jgi:hypothetical protein
MRIGYKKVTWAYSEESWNMKEVCMPASYENISKGFKCALTAVRFVLYPVFSQRCVRYSHIMYKNIDSKG